MQAIKLILFDMDGTLLSSDKTILPSSLEALENASKAGVITGFGTGRSVSELRPYSASLSSLRYGVLESGALIYDFHRQQILQQSCLQPEDVRMIEQISRLEDVMVQFMSDGQIFMSASAQHTLARYHADQFQALYDAIAAWVPDGRQQLLERSTHTEKINLYHRDTEARSRTRARLQEALPHLAFADSEVTSLEISPRGITKGSGLKALCQVLALQPSQCAAVGDADNDLAMLDTAGLAIAMGNANEAVKAASDIIVADNDSGGIAQAVRLCMDRCLVGSEKEGGCLG